jgi:hypothetical protein
MFAPVWIFCGGEYDRDTTARPLSDAIQLRKAPARAKADSVA